MKTLITICARGGSKGIPGKNIKLINNKPLIYYTIRTAIDFASKDPNIDIYLSTDSEEIKNVVDKIGYTSVRTNYTRPKLLATDTAGKIDVIQDVLNYAEQKENKNYDFILDLDVTSPLRSVGDLNSALSELQKDTDAYNIFSVSEASRNPYFNMVEPRENSKYVKLIKEGSFLTRQSAPEVYDMNASFYFYRRSFFSTFQKSPITHKTLAYLVPHICFDLDEPIDFEFMSFLMEKKKLGFKFVE